MSQQQAPPPADPNLDLIQVLLAASSSELLQSLSSAEQLLRSATSRIQRLVEPPPAGEVHGSGRASQHHRYTCTRGKHDSEVYMHAEVPSVCRVGQMCDCAKAT